MRAGSSSRAAQQHLPPAVSREGTSGTEASWKIRAVTRDASGLPSHRATRPGRTCTILRSPLAALSTTPPPARCQAPPCAPLRHLCAQKFLLCSTPSSATTRGRFLRSWSSLGAEPEPLLLAASPQPPAEQPRPPTRPRRAAAPRRHRSPSLRLDVFLFRPDGSNPNPGSHSAPQHGVTTAQVQRRASGLSPSFSPAHPGPPQGLRPRFAALLPPPDAGRRSTARGPAAPPWAPLGTSPQPDRLRGAGHQNGRPVPTKPREPTPKNAPNPQETPRNPIRSHQSPSDPIRSFQIPSTPPPKAPLNAV